MKNAHNSIIYKVDKIIGELRGFQKSIRWPFKIISV
jgi:hypothetical protein